MSRTDSGILLQLIRKLSGAELRPFGKEKKRGCWECGESNHIRAKCRTYKRRLEEEQEERDRKRIRYHERDLRDDNGSRRTDNKDRRRDDRDEKR
ncbi:hypothetical protein DAPPUDRAFT_257661 [Daphnia pulex]|uniref:CCHC-type domain-containing protein n=1 Tax=Daphnia pulex TaxID=6669 RepID=E9HDZ9_DAPPU|nr:hypothetical protein DAPPUDRAFT_257661 [Daphnia pulex]|eukprot:EFX70041.1 hypothetical protein DAPPUDRAFT_257661 [Daphnia pulex]